MLGCRVERLPSSVRDDQIDRGGDQEEDDGPDDPAGAWKIHPSRELICRGWEGVSEAGDQRKPEYEGTGDPRRENPRLVENCVPELSGGCEESDASRPLARGGAKTDGTTSSRCHVVAAA